MSLDFFVTQFYRLIVHDLVLMSDVYWFYSQSRSEGKSIQEFSEILANLLEIESQNFEEINTAKLSIGEGEGVLLIIWDYFHDVFIKHLLDDASQFPFWASKLIVTSRPVPFGMPVIRAYWQCLQNVYHTRGVRGMFEGSLPYMFASCYHNHRFLTKVTLAFISNVFAKIPHPGSVPIEDDVSTSPLSSPKGKPTKSLGAYPKDSLKLAHHASHSTHLPTVTTSGTSTTDSVAPTMFKHKTRSNADLSALMGGGSVGSSVNDDSVVDITIAATTALPFKSNKNKPINSNNNTTTNNTNNNTNNINNTNTTNTNTASNTTTNTNTASSGSYALGTAGTAGAPKGFVNMGSSGVLGYPTSRVAGDGHYSSVATIKPKKHSTPPTTDTMIMRQLQKACVAFMTHPLMVLSAAMVKNPLYQGHTSVVALFKMWSNAGIAGLYRGFRSRFVLSLIPLSPVMLLGIADAIIYRRMDGQGALDSTGGVLSTLKHMVTEPLNSDGSGSVMSLFNYGLLTAVHVVPGFVSFVAMRSLSWLVMGSSLNRKHQISRRKEIVDAHISLIDKKSPYE